MGEPITSLTSFTSFARSAMLWPDDLDALDRLAAAWQMDEADRAIMVHQCTDGAELADGSHINAFEALAFWLAEAAAIPSVTGSPGEPLPAIQRPVTARSLPPAGVPRR